MCSVWRMPHLRAPASILQPLARLLERQVASLPDLGGHSDTRASPDWPRVARSRPAPALAQRLRWVPRDSELIRGSSRSRGFLSVRSLRSPTSALTRTLELRPIGRELRAAGLRPALAQRLRWVPRDSELIRGSTARAASRASGRFAPRPRRSLGHSRFARLAESCAAGLRPGEGHAEHSATASGPNGWLSSRTVRRRPIPSKGETQCSSSTTAPREDHDPNPQAAPTASPLRTSPGDVAPGARCTGHGP